MPLLSVIIPAYNAAATIDACLESVLASVGREGEIICVNDGSTDGTGKKLQQWASKDSRIRIIHQDNGGVSRARNAALGQVTGRYVTFVDADDMVEADFLPSICKAAESTGADCVVAGWKERGRMHQLVEKLTTHEATAEWVAGLPNHTWARVYTAAVLERSGARFLPGLHMGEDTLFNYCLYPWCNKITLIPNAGYLYRHDTLGYLSSRGRESVIGMLDGADALAACYDRHGLLPKHKDMVLRFALHAMDCIRALAPLDRQSQASSQFRSLLRAVGIKEGNLIGLTPGKAKFVRHILEGSSGLGVSFYRKRFVRWLHRR